jgi:hypothetical protein
MKPARVHCSAGFVALNNQEGEEAKVYTTLPDGKAIHETYKPRWSNAKRGSWQSIRETSEAFAAQDRIAGYLAQLPPCTALAAIAWAAWEAGRRYHEADIPRRAIVARMRDRDCQLISLVIERFSDAPHETEEVLRMVDHLPTDLSFAAVTLVLNELRARHWKQVQH